MYISEKTLKVPSSTRSYTTGTTSVINRRAVQGKTVSLESDTRIFGEAQSSESGPETRSALDLTVVSGYAECFVAVTALAVLRIAMRLLGILQ
jgi:hypothetical protein